MKLNYSHKYIENASTCGTIHTENLLNTGKRPQNSDSKKIFTKPGRTKEKKEKEKIRKEVRQDLQPWGELERGKAPAPWEFPPTSELSRDKEEI